MSESIFLFPDVCKSEMQYFEQLIAPVGSKFVTFNSTKTLEINNIIKQCKNTGANITGLVVSVYGNQANYKKLVDFLSPAKVYYISDEFGKSRLTFEYVFEDYDGPIYKNYNHPEYNEKSEKYRKAIHFPLGVPYTNECKVLKLFDNEEEKNKRFDYLSNKPRKYKVSFIGGLKNTRKFACDEAVNAFGEEATFISKNHANWGNLECSEIHPSKMLDVYEDSDFVICPRGNANLNCFRFYEALASGAVPIVQASEAEFKTSFDFGEELTTVLFENCIIRNKQWRDIFEEVKGLPQPPTSQQKRILLETFIQVVQKGKV